MVLNVKVVTHAKRQEVISGADILKVYLKALPVDNKANKELIEILSRHFKVKKSQIALIRGEKSRIKKISIDE